MNLQRVRDHLNRTEGVTDWFLRRAEADQITIIRVPWLFTASADTLSAHSNPEPREVIRAPDENVFITVYSSFEEGGETYLGEAFGQVTSDTDSAVQEVVTSLVASARCQKNRPFPLPEGGLLYPQTQLADPALSGAAHAELLTRAQAFNDQVIDACAREKQIVISNLEVFIRRSSAIFETSAGVKLEYDTTRTDAEICFLARGEGERAGEHTVMLRSRRFADLDPLEFVPRYAGYARAIATADSPRGFVGPVVLERDAAAEALNLTRNPLAFHSNARFVHEQSSRYREGKTLAGEGGMRGESLNLCSDPLRPHGLRSAAFSPEDGSPARKVTVVSDGCFAELLGSRKYLSYLGLLQQGVLPSGPMGNTIVPPGRHSVAELAANDVVAIKTFSAWTVDPVSGDFACEIRLGERRQNGRAAPFKGGMLVGNYFDALGDACFSRETTRCGDYWGPMAIRFNNLTVAG